MASRHRWEYIFRFRWNFYHWVGLLRQAVAWKNSISAHASRPLLYSYWFNDTASALVMAKKMGMTATLKTRVHLYDFEEEFHPRGYIPFRYSEIKSVDAIVPISDYAYNYIRDQHPRANLTRVHRLGVTSCPASIQPSGSPLVLVSCSSLSHYKRPLLLVDLIAHFTQPVVWHHFGSGSMEKEFLEKTAQLPDHIHFHYHGHVSNPEIYRFYENHPVHALINVSDFEGIPVSIMEAMAFGIPVVACDICGIPEIVNQKTGMLLEKKFNPAIEAEKICTWLSDFQQRESERGEIQQFQRINYNAELNYPRFMFELKGYEKN
ncbi:MAG: glycosyltransferase [Bacteroidetes bacterium]|nr:glycosyltransferase [Bacteroidota bacterium]